MACVIVVGVSVIQTFSTAKSQMTGCVTPSSQTTIYIYTSHHMCALSFLILEFHHSGLMINTCQALCHDLE